MQKYQVRFMPEDNVIEVEQGTSLLKAASLAGIFIKSSCGGKGTCGACKVVLLSGEAKAERTGNLSPEQLSKGVRLSCHTFVDGDLTVEVPPESRLQTHQVLLENANSSLLKETSKDLLTSYGHLPLARKINIRCAEPTLTDNASDWARLSLELKRILQSDKPINISLSVLQNLPEVVRQAQWDLSVTLTDLESGYSVIRVEPANDRPAYGLAIDIGTTTVVVYLVNLDT